MKKENTILREQLSVYGEPFHAELRKERTANGSIIYHMYKIYDVEQPVFEEHKRFKGNEAKIYRTFSYDDLYKLCESMRLIYQGYGSIGNKMRMYANCRYDLALRQMFGHCYGIPSLFSPSAAKRVNMFLRWMVRKDEVDVGIWGDFLDKSKLLIPVDTHVMRMAVELGITNQKTANEKAMIEITEYFKAIFPDDPCMGDFALFGYGVNNKLKDI